MTAEVYPSGRKVSYSYDAAGRTKYVTNPGANLNYADLSLFNPSSNQYAYPPNGAIQSMTLGNSVVETWNWDPIRLQPTQTKIGSLLTLNYYYCPQQRNHSILVEMDRSNKRLSVVAARVAG
jgi:YD repeat-containing protein